MTSMGRVPIAAGLAILLIVYAVPGVRLGPVAPVNDEPATMPAGGSPRLVEGETSASLAVQSVTIRPTPAPQATAQHPAAVVEAPRAASWSTMFSGGSTLKIGERIKVTFFEMLDMAENQGVAADRERAQSSLHTFYQRMDLTGDYSIQPDGTITLPRLGMFAVAERVPQVVERDLAQAFQREMGSAATVTVVVTERLPIYVTGLVKNPGSYKHMPGMMALHGVALAGGVERGIATISQHIDSVRERERLQRAQTQLERLLARRARLLTDRNKTATVAAPERLVWLAGERRADELLGEEAALRSFAKSAHHAEVETHRVAVESAEAELSALRRQLPNFDEQIDLHNERLKDVQNLSAKGVVVRKDIISIKSEIADLEGRRQQALVSITQAEWRLAQATQARAKFEADGELKMMQELVHLEQEIEETETTVTAAGSIEGIMHVATGAAAREEPRSVAYEIVRRGPGGSVRKLPAEETSELEPGDVLRISIKDADKQMRASNQP
jgi:protein involved in polysaccharide export with SLBB domain